MLKMKKYVGTAKMRPDSRTPRRLPNAMRTTNATEIGTTNGVSTGNADASAAVPAATDTDDREHVVGQERDAGDLRGHQAEVVPRHHVRAAGRRVRLDRLAVGEDQEARARPTSRR